MILVDTNVVSETLKPAPEPLVIEWLIAHDAELAIPSVTLAELAYGIERIRPEQRSQRLLRGLMGWRERFADRILAFNERAAIIYGEIMGQASRFGMPMAIPDGMIAATSLANGGTLATRNVEDFRQSGVDLVNPWQRAGVQER